MWIDVFDHAARVSQHTLLVCKQMGFMEYELSPITNAALYHDLGKQYIPSSILDKPGKLTTDEFNTIKTHPEIGYEMMLNAFQEFTEIHPIIPLVALQHHERCDGSGYPFSLKTNDICLPAKIIAICDVYEAIRSRRSYKGIMTHQNTMKIIMDDEHKYDPDVLKAFNTLPIYLLDEVTFGKNLSCWTQVP